MIWALVRPKGMITRHSIREFILCSFYSPPQRGKNNKLVQYMIENILLLLTKHPEAGFFLCGDANKVDVSQIMKATPRCKQLVTRPTHASGALDIMLSNLQPKYSVPVIRPQAKPDNEVLGKATDHFFALAIPLRKNQGQKSRDYKFVKYRPTPDSDRMLFGQMLLTVDWNYVSVAESTTEMAERMDTMVSEMVDIAFPVVTVKRN